MKDDMMSVTIQTALYDAMESSILQVECSFMRGFSGLHLIGNASEVCKSGLERARAALEDLNIHIPQKRIVINICPAHSRKDGSHFDLPFAVGLATLISEKTPTINLNHWLFAAELGLDGRLRPVKGVIAFALAAMSEGFSGIIVAQENFEEISALNRLRVNDYKELCAQPFHNLHQVLDWLFNGKKELKADQNGETFDQMDIPSEPNFDDMLLSPHLQKLALVVATGLHSLLLQGAPGTGKSMFSARLSSIMPRISREEHLETLKIHSTVLQKLPESLLYGRPPFRAPHHQSSAAALMGIPEQPGEISLAHGGLLFLDEFPEFRRDIIEALREPLETGFVRVSRAKKKVTWQSRMTLIAACNSCPCGWLGSTLRRCTCPSAKILAYRRKLSGPILDRIDLHVRMPDLASEGSDIFIQLQKRAPSSLSQSLREQVAKARLFSDKRNQKLGLVYNRDLEPDQLIEASGLASDEFKKLVDSHTPKYATRRALIRSLRVARTLADLDGVVAIQANHLGQAWRWLPDSTSKSYDGYT